MGGLIAVAVVALLAALLLGRHMLKNHAGRTNLPVAGLFVLMSGIGFGFAVLVAACWYLMRWFGDMFAPG